MLIVRSLNWTTAPPTTIGSRSRRRRRREGGQETSLLLLFFFVLFTSPPSHTSLEPRARLGRSVVLRRHATAGEAKNGTSSQRDRKKVSRTGTGMERKRTLSTSSLISTSSNDTTGRQDRLSTPPPNIAQPTKTSGCTCSFFSRQTLVSSVDRLTGRFVKTGLFGLSFLSPFRWRKTSEGTCP